VKNYILIYYIIKFGLIVRLNDRVIIKFKKSYFDGTQAPKVLSGLFHHKSWCGYKVGVAYGKLHFRRLGARLPNQLSVRGKVTTYQSQFADCPSSIFVRKSFMNWMKWVCLLRPWRAWGLWIRTAFWYPQLGINAFAHLDYFYIPDNHPPAGRVVWGSQE